LSRNDQQYFETLKNKIVATMQQSYPGINPLISEWKGQEITDFQEELLNRVNAHISEKWFYTHMKSVSKSLPRIDVLNLLSKYVGYANWDDFVFQNRDLIQPAQSTETSVADVRQHFATHANRYFILVPLAAVIVVLFFFGVFKLFNTREYKFCFYDFDTKELITQTKIEVQVLLEGETPVTSICNPNGCFFLKTDKSMIRMVVKAQYYQADTITRVVTKLNRDEMVKLKADDYAMMIHYFSTMKVDDWEKRKKRLEAMIDDDAIIYQVVNDREATGMALFNKQEFIDKMTMPSGSLRNIEILGTQVRNEKIMALRFRINDKKR
jgi:hypothetical protein